MRILTILDRFQRLLQTHVLLVDDLLVLLTPLLCLGSNLERHGHLLRLVAHCFDRLMELLLVSIMDLLLSGLNSRYLGLNPPRPFPANRRSYLEIGLPADPVEVVLLHLVNCL